MHSYLKQSTASQSRSIGPFLDDTDFKTAETGLTIANTDIKLMINGAASADKNSGGGTHRANGVYGITFDATDTATVGEIFVSVKVAGALPVFATFVVVEEAVYDMLFAASAIGYIANAAVNVAQFGGSNGTFSGGRPEVNTSHAAGTAWGSGAITAGSIANDAITAAKLASDVGPEIMASTPAAGGPYPGLGIIAIGTAQAADANSITLAAGFSATAANMVGVSVFVYSSTNGKYARGISTAYNDGTKVLTVSGLGEAPTGTVLYVLYASPSGQLTGTQTFDMVGDITGNLSGSVGSVTNGVTLAANAITAAATAADFTTEIQSGLATAAELAKVPKSDSNVTWNATALASINAEADTAISDVGLTTTITGRIDAAITTRATPAQILTTALTEAYAADGAAGTLSQILFAIQAFLQERSVAGTTLTVNKLDGTTAAMTFTLDDGTSPTAITRAT